MAAVKRELGGYKNALLVMLYQTAFAWVAAFSSIALDYCFLDRRGIFMKPVDIVIILVLLALVFVAFWFFRRRKKNGGGCCGGCSGCGGCPHADMCAEPHNDKRKQKLPRIIGGSLLLLY